MAEILFVVEEAPEGGYTARALGFSIYTEADTWEELKIAVQDAVQCHFDKNTKPRVIRLHYLREEILAV
ncbi:MAG: 2-oxoisovalerate dehydrogenase [Chloroflexota bacterium]|nr:MAG: 2-oxoisovalerate dehydrogenase [Chloroflexota bacterium]